MQAGTSPKSPSRGIRLVRSFAVCLAAAWAFAATPAQAQLSSLVNPWASLVADPGCMPVADTGGPYTAVAGGQVQLSATASGTAPLTILWAVSSGSLSDPTILDPVFTAMDTVSPVTATLTVIDACGSATVATTITVDPATPPTTGHVPPMSVFSGATGSFTLSGTDPNVPPQPLTFTVTQTCLLGLRVTSTGPDTALVTYTAPILPICQVAPLACQLVITATNAGGASSTEFTTITILPSPDVVIVTAAEYRVKKQRLDVTATSSVVCSNVVFVLQPYLTAIGTIFDPTPFGIFTNTGGGIYTLLLVGFPEPAVPPATPIVVKSNLNGASAPSPIAERR